MARRRFFGGGLSGAQKDIIQILDQDEDISEQHMTLPECRKTLLALEKAIEKNREMRVSSFELFQAPNSSADWPFCTGIDQKPRQAEQVGL